jgi:hypothetical protein
MGSGWCPLRGAGAETKPFDYDGLTVAEMEPSKETFQCPCLPQKEASRMS